MPARMLDMDTMDTGLGTTTTRTQQVLPISITEQPVSNMEYKPNAAIVKVQKE